jgi:hypothetical protein
MSSENFKTTWIEFNAPVYVGEEGYVSSIKLTPDENIGQGRTLAVAHWQEKGMWFFQLPSQKCVAVPNSNVRYVYGEIIRLAHEGIVSSADAVADDMPKRRGRPPKAKE